MKTRDAITALGTAMGLPGLALDGENTCTLMIDGKQEVCLSGDPDGHVLRLCAVLGDMAALRADPGRMLEVNYDPTESGGGTLSINRMNSEVVYVKTLDLAGLDAADVTAAMERFIGYATFWLENIGVLTAPDSGGLGTGAGTLDETIIRI